LESYEDPNYVVQPFYWVDGRTVRSRIGDRWPREWLMGFKDVTAATNERTVLASVIPFTAVSNKLPLLLIKQQLRPQYTVALLANLNALVLDYVARQKVGGVTLNYFLVKQFPVLPPSSYTATNMDFIVPRVLELTYTAHDVTPWARDLGYQGEPFRWDPYRRAVLRAELDAYYAHLYGLTRDDVRYVLDPAEVRGSGYPSETFRGLKHNEEREFGEYRTKRLMLEAWDRLELVRETPAAPLVSA
jgi:hypothetical protein